LSPILFDVFIDDLAYEIEKVSDCKVYLYADDLAVLTDSEQGARVLTRMI